MPNCDNRLTVIGPVTQVRKFVKSEWDITLGARHGEFLENSPGRYVCQFKTQGLPLAKLQRLSGQWLRLVLLLDYELQAKRIKGLAMARGNQLENHQIKY
jgi:hypothetical protein